MQLVGLDIETTGVDINRYHRLIQIGIAFSDPANDLVRDVRPVGDMMIQQDALNVNHFTLDRIGQAQPQHVVDDQLGAELARRGYKRGELTPVGWNVGGFDITFIKKELPRVASFFSYRTLDLTGVAMMHELRTGKGYRDTKDEFHKRIVERLGRDERHDALYDAQAALVAVELFKEL